MTSAEFTISPDGLCVFKESSYLLQADRRGMIRRYAAGMGFFLLLKERSHLVDPSPLFFTKKACGGKAFHAQTLHWQWKHQEMHLWHHRHPAAALRVHIAILLLCCPRKNLDVAPDCGSECPTGSKASIPRYQLSPYTKPFNKTSGH